MNEAWLRRLWIAATLALAILIVHWSLAPQPPVPETLIPDKVGHALAYFTLALFGSGIAVPARLWITMLRCSLLGGALEISQALFTEHRSAEWGDLLADLAGILVAWLIVAQGRAGWGLRAYARLLRRRGG